MKIKLKSKELVKIRKQLRDALEKYGEQQKALVKLNQDHKKEAYKIDRIKNKGLKILDTLLKKDSVMKEFDYFINYEAINDEELECEIQNFYEDSYGSEEAIKKKLREFRDYRGEEKGKKGPWIDETMHIGHEK